MMSRHLDRLALILAVGSLLILGLRPTRVVEVRTGSAVVRTAGATAAEAQAVADSLHLAVIDLHDLAAVRSAATLHLVGWGLDAAELRRTAGHSIVPHPRPLPDGIQGATWPTSVALGEEVRVDLTVATSRRMDVVLSAPTGPVDSTTFARGTASRVLRHRPTAEGAVLYTIRAGGETDTFSVLVTPAYAPAALLLGAAPSRELSDLRDWLARQGGSVTLRTPISRDRSRVERVNVAGTSSTPLMSSALAQTALIVTDGRGLLALSADERRALRTAVEGGAGLVVTLDDTARDPQRWSAEERRVFLPWTLTPIVGLDERQVRPRADGRPLSATPIEAEGAVLGALPFGATPLLDDGQGGILAAVLMVGRGRVVGSVVTGTGRWIRGGERSAYAEYWQALVKAAARPDPRGEWIALTPGPVLAHRALTIRRPTAAGRVARIDEDSVLFTADPLAPDQSVGVWWPKAAGWRGIGGQKIWVSGNDAWRSWQAAERRRETEMRPLHAWQEFGPSTDGVEIPWPLWPFFVLFVLSAGWCWRKVSR